MKKYKSPNDLLDYMILKGIIIEDKENTVNKIKKYSYYSIINSYKDVFKDSKDNYKKMLLLMKYMHYMSLIKI